MNKNGFIPYTLEKEMVSLIPFRKRCFGGNPLDIKGFLGYPFEKYCFFYIR